MLLVLMMKYNETEWVLFLNIMNTGICYYLDNIMNTRICYYLDNMHTKTSLYQFHVLNSMNLFVTKLATVTFGGLWQLVDQAVQFAVFHVYYSTCAFICCLRNKGRQLSSSWGWSKRRQHHVKIESWHCTGNVTKTNNVTTIPMYIVLLRHN